MVLRKPYALLIKYFRIIHLVMGFLTGIILYSFLNIRNVFKTYIDSGWLASKNLILDHNYINPFTYILIIIVIASLILLYILMKFKKKPRLFYGVVLIYNILLLALLIFNNNIFNQITSDILSTSLLKLCDDINVIALFISLIVFIVLMIRGLGFDIKKFNFDKDIQELKITAADNEEFELVLGIDNEEYQRKFRRQIRELKIYYKENKFIVNAILSSIIVAIVLITTLVVLIFDNTYRENRKVKIADQVYLKVTDSFITEKNDFDSKITDKKILLVEFELINKSNDGFQIPTNILNINFQNIIYHPITNEYSNFFTRGTGYTNQVIKSNSKEKYIIIYEIDKQEKYRKLYISYKDKKIKLKPTNLTEMNIVNIGESVKYDLGGGYSFDFKIKHYDISKSFSKLVLDINDKYVEADTFEGTLPDGMTILKLIGVSTTPSEDSFKITDLSYDDSVIIYNYNGVTVNYQITDLYKYYDGRYVYIIAPEELMYAKKIVLSIRILDQEYNYIIRNS